MTVSDTTPKEQFPGDGVTVAFPFNHLFFENSDVQVKKLTISTGIEQIITTGFTTTGAGSPTGGLVTFDVAPTTDERTTLERIVDLDQNANYRENEGFPSDEHEQQMDRQTMMIQQQDLKINRSITLQSSVLDAFNKEIQGQPIIGASIFVNETNDGFVFSVTNLLDLNQAVIDADASATAAATSETNAATSETNAASSAAAALVSEDNAAASAGTTTNLLPSPQDTPDDTIETLAGSIFDPFDRTKSPTAITAGAADSVTFPVVGADSRIDLLVVDKTGTFSRVAGVQSASPVAPAYPIDKETIAEATIDETVTVVLDTADIRDVRRFKDFMQGTQEIKRLSFTRATNVSGVQNIAHGLTGTPRSCEIFMTGAAPAQDGFSVGRYYETEDGVSNAQACMFQINNGLGTGAHKNSDDFVAVYADGGTVKTFKGVLSFDETNATMTWTIVATPATKTMDITLVIRT